jgi:Type II restriction endonuclease EcoO109I
MILDTLLCEEIGRLLGVLYGKRFAALDNLSLNRLLAKNPYLYRALGIADPSEFITQLMVAFVSSSDETIFGNDFIEPLAIFAAKNAMYSDGSLRSVTVGAGAGQDIAIETATSYLAISVKSSTNIFNSQSSKGQDSEFVALRARLKKLNKEFRPIIGYGYGRKQTRKASNVEKLAGQMFWQLLTGEVDFYLRISAAMHSFADQHGDQYKNAFAQKNRQLLREFMLSYVNSFGDIDWNGVVAFNSAQEKPKQPK